MTLLKLYPKVNKTFQFEMLFYCIFFRYVVTCWINLVVKLKCSLRTKILHKTNIASLFQKNKFQVFITMDHRNYYVDICNDSCPSSYFIAFYIYQCVMTKCSKKHNPFSTKCSEKNIYFHCSNIKIISFAVIVCC